jgi:hypothetical protein
VIQSSLAPIDERCFLIAGVDQSTVVDLKPGNSGENEFVYVMSQQGDGTVPLHLAKLANLKTYYAAATHTGLLYHRKVALAVRDLLKSGQTTALPTTYEPARRAVEASISDHQLQEEELFGGRAGNALTERERRLILESAFSLPRVVEPAGLPATARAQPPRQALLAGVVVGRRRQHRVDLELVSGSITDVDVRAVVLGVFQNVRPTGPSAAFNRLLDGAIDEFVSRRMFSAGLGEVFMLPTGTHPVRAQTVLFAGLGQFDQFGSQAQQLAAVNVIRTLIRAGIDEFATLLFGGGSAQESDESLENLVRGFFRGLLDVDHSHRFRRIILCELDPQRFARMRDRLYALTSTSLFDDVEVTIDERPPLAPTWVAAPPDRRDARPALLDPMYLTVRWEQQSPGDEVCYVRSALLTAGSKATVYAAVRECPLQDLNDHIATLPAVTEPELAGFGERLTELVFTGDFVDLLGRDELLGRGIILVHDTESSRIPWETICLRGTFPAVTSGLTRRYMAENLTIAKWLEQRRLDDLLEVLLVINPTLDLAGAEREGRDVARALAQLPAVRVTTRHGRAATRDVLLDDLQSGRYDVVHYAGHAYFNAINRQRSGVLCHGQEVLAGEDLVGLGNLPALVFFNACESGRVRKPVGAPPVQRDVMHSVGFAEAFLRSGVANFVGTYWPVEDDPAVTFAREFYRELIDGQPLGAAILDARRAVRDLNSKDWADYLFYGDPRFTLKRREV